MVSGAQHDLSSLWEIDDTGRNPYLLLPKWKESPYQCCGNWSADGKYYYFQAGHGSDQAIWALPECRYSLGQAGPRPSRLISGPPRFTSPVPVNDGKRLLVMGQEPRVELLRYDFRNRRFDFVSSGNFSRFVRLLPRSEVDHLRFVSRHEPLAKSSGWRRQNATYVSTCAGLRPEVVSGRFLDPPSRMSGTTIPGESALCHRPGEGHRRFLPPSPLKYRKIQHGLRTGNP